MNVQSKDKITLSFPPSKNFFALAAKNNPKIRVLLLGLLISSCAQSINQNIERGAGYLFREGYPEVRLSAIGLFDEQGNPGIHVTADIVYGSLIYKEVEKKQTAHVNIEVRIVESDKDEHQSVIAENFSIDIAEDNNSITSSQDVFSFNKRFPVTPGNYTIYLTVLDQNSDKHITRTASALIPHTGVQYPVLTNIQLLGKDNEANDPAYVPMTTYDVAKNIDSLKFIFQVTNGDVNNPVTINSELLRFKSDTVYARPMSFPNPSPSTIEYKGIDYHETETIQTSRRVLKQTGSVLVEFRFPIQSRGNYRFKAEIENARNEDNNLFKARDFSIRSKNYPTVKTPCELARPLVYLMGDKEYEKLMDISNPDSLKRAIDAFWLKNIGNKSKAKQVISLYYQRVEEANKQFSNFKEGWKTDPGMMYILFGKPFYSDQYIDRMIWFYSYNRGDPRETFHFTKPKIKHPAYPFDHFILVRNFYYNNLEYQQRQLWLSGLILNGNI